MEKINYDNIGIESDGDIIFITVAKYKLFMSYGKIGTDAYVLYSHLMFTARIQSTNKVKAKDIYLRKGLSWGSDRLLKAKKLLIELELIKKEQRFDENGNFSGSYIEIKTKTTPFEIESIKNNATLDNGIRETRSPSTENKCLNKKYKCLNKELNALLNYILEYWNKKNIYNHKQHTLLNNIKKRHKDIISEYDIEQIKKAIDNYNSIIKDEKYYFNHKWSLWDFIINLYKFIDDASPLTNYLNKKIQNNFKQNNNIPPNAETPLETAIRYGYATANLEAIKDKEHDN